MKQAIEWFDEVQARHFPSFLRDGPKLLILALHSVFADKSELDREVVHPQQGTLVAELGQAVTHLQEAGYRFVRPTDIEADLNTGGKYCLLTFDDGYANNLGVLPLLEEHRTPAVFFAVPENIERNRSFWWDAVYRKGRREGMSPEEIDRFIEQTKRLAPSAIMPHLRQAGFSDGDFRPVGDIDRPMTPAELKALAQSPYTVVGNHTYAHEILTRCSPAEQRQTIRAAQEFLASSCGCAPTIIAYPNGAWSPEVLRAAMEAGLRLGVTLDERWQAVPLRGAPESKMRLGRFVLWGGQDAARQCRRMRLRFSLTGFARQIKRRWV